jgi:two-component system, NarL family, sensor kinase
MVEHPHSQGVCSPGPYGELSDCSPSHDPDSITKSPPTETLQNLQPIADIPDEVLRIHEYERQRLGQELHDSAGQLLISLQLSVAHLRRVETDGTHEDLIEEIQDTVARIEREIRSLAFLHYPAELGERTLCCAVEALTLGFGRRTGIHASFKCVGDNSAIEESISKEVLRVAQEALVNIHRHAHASSADVILEQRPGCLELTVADDGVGIANQGGQRGIGLEGMRHRIEGLGGHFEITRLMHGTQVWATVPIAA